MNRGDGGHVVDAERLTEIRRLGARPRPSAPTGADPLHSTGIVITAASACLLLATLVARRSAQPSPA